MSEFSRDYQLCCERGGGGAKPTGQKKSRGGGGEREGEDNDVHYACRWKEELEVEVKRWQEKVQQLEKEKSEAVLSLKCKLDSVEVSKITDVNTLKDLHRYD